MKNKVSLAVTGRYALFTDPVTKIGGEKFSYHLPTYEALKGILKAVYWKPTFIWVIDRVRIMNPIQTQSKGIKPLKLPKGNSLAFYTFLTDVHYQIDAHFEWNVHQKNLIGDRIDGKHFAIASRSIKKGGRRNVVLGTSECAAYIEPCVFGEGTGAYDNIEELDFGLMFHGFDYPDETGKEEFHSRFWQAKLNSGILDFPRPEECPARRFIRRMLPKQFDEGVNLLSVEKEETIL